MPKYSSCVLTCRTYVQKLISKLLKLGRAFHFFCYTVAHPVVELTEDFHKGERSMSSNPDRYILFLRNLVPSFRSHSMQYIFFSFYFSKQTVHQQVDLHFAAV